MSDINLTKLQQELTESILRLSNCLAATYGLKDGNNSTAVNYERIDKTQKANRDSVFQETDPIMILRQALSSIARLRVDFDYIMTDDYKRLIIAAILGADIDALDFGINDEEFYRMLKDLKSLYNSIKQNPKKNPRTTLL